MPRTRAGARIRTELASSRRHSAAPIARLTTTKPSALQPLLRRVDAREAEAAAIGDVNAPDRGRLALHQRPDAQRLEDAPAAVGQSRGALVEARLPERAERVRLDQDDVETRARPAPARGSRRRGRRRRSRRRRAHEIDALARRASLMSSVSRWHPLLSASRRSAPRCHSPVTATSSSMRTPMFHQRFATPFVPAECRSRARLSAPCRARARAIARRSCSRRRRARPCRASDRSDA